MKIIDARSGIEITVGIKVGYAHGESLKLLAVDEASKLAKVEVTYREAIDDKTVAERPKALEVASKMADRKGHIALVPELGPLKTSTVDVEMQAFDNYAGFPGECVLVLPS